MIVVVMGVSGVGKTTIGQALAAKVGWRYLDADDYHPPANVTKMAAGTPLQDEDRWPWLDRLNSILRKKDDAILGCSALKEAYRKRLTADLKEFRIVYLRGSFDLLSRRAAERKHRFMPASLLKSQFETLFGSRIFVRGFLLNNQLTDFDFVPGGPNQVEAGKRPRSSTTPTIVFAADGSVRLAAGSAGGSMIISYTAKTLVAALDWNLDMQAAVAAPNLGNRSGPTEIEQGSAWEALAPALRSRGHEVTIRELQSGTQGIERVPGGWRGGADPRRDGSVKGD